MKHQQIQRQIQQSQLKPVTKLIPVSRRLDSTSDNHILFETPERPNVCFVKSLVGNDVINVFDRHIMNLYLEQFIDRIGFEITYDNIIGISVYENNDNVINDLPIHLRHLRIGCSSCTSIVLSSSVKQSIQFISIDESNMTTLIDISDCPQLTTCQINQAAITDFSPDYPLPSNLTTLNLSKNLISNTDPHVFAYDTIRDAIIDKKTCKFKKTCVDFSYNTLTFDQFPDDIAMRCNIVKQNKYNYIPITRRNVGHLNIQQFLENQFDTAAPSLVSQITGSQSVHLSSINKSVVASIDAIKQFIKEKGLSVVTVSTKKTGLLDNCFTHHTDEFYEFYAFCKKYNLKEQMDEFFSVKTVHSVTRLTYAETFDLVWTAITNAESVSKDDALERLSIELTDSNGVCFVGKYNRLINSLIGIVDGVCVGISKGEEIQLEFERIIVRLNETINLPNTTPEKDADAFSSALCEAKHILDGDETMDVWINALMDYAPSPTNIVINGVDYLHTWDNFILDRMYQTVVGCVEYCSQQPTGDVPIIYMQTAPPTQLQTNGKNEFPYPVLFEEGGAVQISMLMHSMIG